MTPRDIRDLALRDATRAAVIAALKSTGPARTTEIADKSGMSARKAARCLAGLHSECVVWREQGDGYRDPVIWTLTLDSKDVPEEYLKVASIWRVGHRVAEMMGAQA